MLLHGCSYNRIAHLPSAVISITHTDATRVGFLPRQYGFPQSFTFKGYADPTNGPLLRQKNDKLQSLWDVVDVLQPSIYLAQWGASAASLAKMNAAQINTTMEESVRIQGQVRSRKHTAKQYM